MLPKGGRMEHRMEKEYVVFDIETTGFNPVNDRIIEIGAIKIKEDKIVEKFSELISPGIKIPRRITEVTGIDDSMVINARGKEEVISDFLKFCDCEIIMGHNLSFDYSFVSVAAIQIGSRFEKLGIDTLKIAKKNLKHLDSRRLDYLCEYYGIKDENHHRAENDAMVTYELYRKLCEEFETSDEKSFIPEKMFYKYKKPSPITPRQKSFLQSLMRYHGIRLDKNVDELSKSEASKQIDKIISTYGRMY